MIYGDSSVDHSQSIAHPANPMVYLRPVASTKLEVAMHFNSFQNFVLLGLSLYYSQPSLTQETPPSLCATGVHAILMRGQGPGDHLNVMVSVQNLVLQMIPGSSCVALPYNHGTDDHRTAASNGSYMMQDYIRSYVASCPDSKIFVHGYSLVSDPLFVSTLITY
jgi:hypothetical protein